MLRGEIENIPCANILIQMFKCTDSNCVRILAPTNLTPQDPASFDPSEHVGHVSRYAAHVMSDVMNDSTDMICENNTYGHGFIFVCRLREDTNHAADGYAIDVVVLSINSDSWTNLFVTILGEKGIFCTKLN